MTSGMKGYPLWALLTVAALAAGPLVLSADPDWPVGRLHPPRSRSYPARTLLVRPINGVVPTRKNPLWGAAGTQLTRWGDPEYADGSSAMAGPERPSPRAVSQAVNREDQAVPNAVDASSFLWQWGQFLDHDLDLTATGDEAADIAVPAGDLYFDPTGTGMAVIPFFRSVYDPATGWPDQPRQQINLVTAYIDASNVYGSDPDRATALRTSDGTGRLRTGAGELLPFNVDGLPNGGGPSPEFFLAGDVRANEQVALTAMHILFVREHNRWAVILRALNPSWSGERIYQQARVLIGAEIQAITYREFLPLLLGEGALPAYSGYRDEADPSISNIFSTVAFRLGHSLLNPQLLRLAPDGSSIPAGPVDLQNAFFRPDLVSQPGALDELLRGLAAQRARALDPFVTDAVRNFLFGAPGAGGFDLAALNIQRGRDHGIPDYNSCRVKLGLTPKTCFAAISSDPEIQSRLEEAYGRVENIDAWVGGLAEDRLPGALVGELFYVVLRKQFRNVRDGDPFWHQRVLDAGTRQLIEHLTLSRIIQLNTGIGDELAEDVFRAPASAPY